MAQTLCARCQSAVFLGEQHCARCGAPTPEAIASFGQDQDGGGGHAPPPEGLDLIVKKGLTDQQMGRERTRDDDSAYDAFNLGRSYKSPMGMASNLAAMSKPERDQDGKVIWDPKHAIVGLLVLLICASVVIGYFYLSYRNSAYRYIPKSAYTQYDD